MGCGAGTVEEMVLTSDPKNEAKSLYTLNDMRGE